MFRLGSPERSLRSSRLEFATAPTSHRSSLMSSTKSVTSSTKSLTSSTESTTSSTRWSSHRHNKYNRYYNYHQPTVTFHFPLKSFILTTENQKKKKSWTGPYKISNCLFDFPREAFLTNRLTGFDRSWFVKLTC